MKTNIYWLILSCLLSCDTFLCAQTPTAQEPSPYELLFVHRKERDLSEFQLVDRMRVWFPKDGAPFAGQLVSLLPGTSALGVGVGYAYPTGALAFQMPDGTRQTSSLDRFTTAGKLLIHELLAPRLELPGASLFEERFLRVTSDLTFAKPPQFVVVYVYHVDADYLYWRSSDGDRYRSKHDVLEPQSLQKVRADFDAYRAMPEWRLATSLTSFSGILVGTTGYSHIFKPVYYKGHWFDEEIEVPVDLLLLPDRARAEQDLAKLPNGGAQEKTTNRFSMAFNNGYGPQKLVAVDGETLKWIALRGPELNSESVLSKMYPADRFRAMIEVERFKAASTNADKEIVQKAASLAVTFAEQAPWDFYQVGRVWELKRPFWDSLPGRLIGGNENYYNFETVPYNPQESALQSGLIPREHLSESARLKADWYLDRLQWLEQHSIVYRQPSMRIDNRWLRDDYLFLGKIDTKNASSPQIVKLQEFTFDLRGSPGRLDHLLSEDRYEVELVAKYGDELLTRRSEIVKLHPLEEKAIKPSYATLQTQDLLIGAPERRDAQTLANAAMINKAMGRADNPYEDAKHLRQAFAHQPMASPVGKHGFDFLVEIDGVVLLANPSILSPKSAAFARLIADFEYKDDPTSIAEPSLRLIGYTDQPVVVREADLLLEGQPDLLNVKGEKIELKYDLIARTEVEVQKRVVREFRGTETDAKTLEAYADFTRKARQELLVQAEDNLPKTYVLADTNHKLSGVFKGFDLDDVILSHEGTSLLFRVSQFCFAETDLAAFAKSAELSKAKPGDFRAVGEFFFRRVDGSTALGRPLEYSDTYLIAVQNSTHKVVLNKNATHPADWNAMRAYLHQEKTKQPRDTTVDAVIKESVPAAEIYSQPGELAEAWKKKLDQLNDEYSIEWQAVRTVNGQAVALSENGEMVAAMRDDLQVIDIASERTWSTGLKMKPMFTGFHPFERALLLADRKRVVLFNFESKEFKVIHKWEQDIVAASRLPDKAGLVVMLASGDLALVDLKNSKVIDLKDKLKNAGSGKELFLSVSSTDQSIKYGSAGYEFSYSYNPETMDWKLTDENRPLEEMVAPPTAAPERGSNQRRLPIAKARFVKSRNPAEIQDSHHPLLQKYTGVKQFGGSSVLHVVGCAFDSASKDKSQAYSAFFNHEGDPVCVPQTLIIPENSPVVVSEDGNTVGVQNGEQIEILRCPDPVLFWNKRLNAITEEIAYSNDALQIDAAWRYLRTEPFQSLGSYPDEAAETYIDALFECMSNYRWQDGGDLAQRKPFVLERWQEAMPNSELFQTLKAMDLRNEAWIARGTGFVNTTTEEGMQEFYERMVQTAEIVFPLIQKENPPSKAFELAFEIAMSLSMPGEQLDKLNAIFTASPCHTSRGVHDNAALLLLPRWHGEPGDTERYITSAADVIGGNLGDSLYMEVMLTMCNFYPSNQPIHNFLQADLDRLNRGLAAYYDRPRDAGVARRILNIFAVSQRWDLYHEAMEILAARKIMWGPYSENSDKVMRERDAFAVASQQAKRRAKKEPVESVE